MKKIISIVALLLIFCVFASCSSCKSCKSCSSCKKQLVISSGGELYNKETGVSYKVAPPNYEAISWEKEIYMEDQKGIAYHRVLGADGQASDPPLWLYNYDFNRLLYNSNEVTLPTLSEMNADTMTIYLEENVKIYLAVEEEKETVQKVVALLDGHAFKFNGNEPSDSYRMSFASKDHPYITYNLIYMEFESDQFDYVSLKDFDYTTKEEVEAEYSFIKDVPYEIIAEEDGTFAVAYNIGKYFIYDRYTGACYMAEYVNELYTIDGEEGGNTESGES